jgi:protein phosphatase
MSTPAQDGAAEPPGEAEEPAEALSFEQQAAPGLSMAAATHSGKVRRHNEDNFALDAAAGLGLVSDGVGGLRRGAQASRLVCETVLQEVRGGRSPEQALRLADQRMAEYASGHGVERIGATAVVAQLHGDVLKLYWVGDSRAYLWRSGELRQLTRDHSLVAKLVEMGVITAEEAETHPNKNVLVNALGGGAEAREVLEVAEVPLPIHLGDRILLSSDGLHGYLPQDRLRQILAATETPAVAVRALLEATLAETKAGDNVTAVCIDLG